MRVDDYMRSIKNHLQEAVSACIKAAGHEFEPKVQRALMKVQHSINQLLYKQYREFVLNLKKRLQPVDCS